MENILFSLVLKTGTVNNSLIITSTSLQPSLLGAWKILHHVTRYETPARKRVLFSYFTNWYHYCKRSGIDTSIPAFFSGIRNCTQWKKLNYFTFNIFYLFAGDDIKMSDLELYFCIVVRYKCFCKKLGNLRTAIYLWEKVYYKDIIRKN